MPTDHGGGDGDDQPPTRQPADDQAGPPGPITRRALFGIFLKAGLAFGGGLGILAVLEQELVTKRRGGRPRGVPAAVWAWPHRPQRDNDCLAVAYGYRFAGLTGTGIALCGLVLPALVLTVALTAAYGLLQQQGWLLELLPVTILPAALAFIVVAGLRLGRDVFHPSRELLLAAAAFLGAVMFHLNPVVLLLAGGGRDAAVRPQEGGAVSLLELCVTVTALVYNAVTFGNGPVMVPLLQADLVDRRGVLSSDQLLYAFTIARITPGQANTYVAAIGYMLQGLVGVLACTVAIVLPGYLMLPLLWGYERLRAVRLVPAFTRGLPVASVGLIFAATLSIGRATLTGWVSLVVFAAALAMAQLLKWNPLLVLAVSALIGIGAQALGWADPYARHATTRLLKAAATQSGT